MFTNSIRDAMTYTWPIIICYRQHDTKCLAQLGSCIIINPEGWFITAAHLFQFLNDLQSRNKAYNDKCVAIMKIQADTTLKQHQKANQMSKYSQKADDITNQSVFIGPLEFNGQIRTIKEADLALGQLAGFKNEMVAKYPILKHPYNDILPGSSLCKLGFPFYAITPSFIENTSSFTIPQLPPHFPIDGIMTRVLDVDPFKIGRTSKFIETSAPGLPGQSGGPIFDIHGRVWAMQSITWSYDLNFSTLDESNLDSKGKERNKHLQYEFFNVGGGPHISVISNFLSQNNIDFTKSSD